MSNSSKREIKLLPDAKFIYTKDLWLDDLVLFGSREIDSYIKFGKNSMRFAPYIISLLRDGKEIKLIRQCVSEHFPGLEVDLDVFISRLSEAGLLVGSKKLVDDEVSFAGVTLFKVVFHRKSEDNLKKSVIFKFYKYIFKSKILLPLLLFIGGFAVLRKLSSGSEIFWGDIDFLLQDLISFVLLTLLCFAVHEGGHFICAVGNGISLKDLSFNMYLGIMPILCFRYYDIKTISSRSKLSIVLGGVYANTLSVVFCYAVGNLTGGFVSRYLCEFAFLNCFMVVTNLVPTRLSDGYYAFSLLTNRFDIRISFWRVLLGFKDIKTVPLSFMLYFLAMIATIVGTVIVAIRCVFSLLDRGNVVACVVASFILLAMIISSIYNVVWIRRR